MTDREYGGSSENSAGGQPQEQSAQPSIQEVIDKQKEQCIFCKIISGDIPTVKVYEDTKVLVIMDINPSKPGHMLVMPKEHYPLLPWVPRETFKHMFTIGKYVARALEDVTGEKAQFFIASGGSAGQQSTHFMYHIIPNLPLLNPKGSAADESTEQLKQVLAANVPLAMQKVAQEDAVVSQFLKTNDSQKDAIAHLIDSNEEFRDMLMNNPEMLKEKINTDPNLAKVFEGIDIDALSEKLRGMYGGS